MMWYKGISHWIYQTFLDCIIHQDHVYENLNKVFFFYMDISVFRLLGKINR